MLTAKQRKQLWRQRGGNLTATAKAAGCSKNHVRLVLTGERRSPKVEQYVADVLGIPVDVAFPKRLFVRKPRKEAAA